jgi:hypothetical protein
VLHECEEALCKRFATHEPLAAVLHECPEALCKRFATHEPLAAHISAKLAGIPDFSALSDLFAGAPGKLPEVPRDLLPVAGELRRVLAPFFDDVGRISGHRTD